MSKSTLDRFSEIGRLSYKTQAIFFLNAFWYEFGHDAEKVWEYTHAVVKFDQKKELGCHLEEFEAHKFLENVGDAKTVLELREILRKIDLNNDHYMSLLEYLVHKFGADIEVLMSRPQDVISVDLKKYEKADPKFLDLVSHLQRANADLKTAQHALDLVRAEINEIEKQKKELEEEAHKDGVKAGIAQTKLNLLISSDHSKLNEATLHAEAMVRKVKPAAEIARKAWAEYTDAHPDVKKDLSEIRDQGAVWWIEREMVEFKKYRPRAN